MPKHVEFKYQHKGQYKDLQDDFQYVELYKHVGDKKAPKMLFVLDYMPKEDLASGRLCSGQTGELLRRLLQVASTFYKSKKTINDWSWLVVTYNSFRTAGKPEEFRQGAEQEFESRLKNVITQYKPKVVVTFGSKPMYALNKQRIQELDNKEQHLYGQPVPTTITYNKDQHEFLHVPTLSLNTLVNPDTSGTQMYLAGYVARNLMNALNAKNVYAIPEIKFEPILVDSIKKFDRMLDQLIKAKVVAVDTETTNLNRRTNKLLTVQFSDRSDRAFFLPVYHKDSPFTGKELKYIRRRLRDYFESDNNNDYQVYTNAKFDLTVLRSNLGIRFFKADVWDIQGGDFCFHPDTFVETEIGKIKIKELIELQDKPKVLSYNHETRTLEYKRILFSSEHESSERMVELEYEGGLVQVTENHKVWSNTRQCYIEVKYLTQDEEIIVLDEPLS
jgi:hypothetical protein